MMERTFSHIFSYFLICSQSSVLTKLSKTMLIKSGEASAVPEKLWEIRVETLNTHSNNGSDQCDLSNEASLLWHCGMVPCVTSCHTISAPGLVDLVVSGVLGFPMFSFNIVSREIKFQPSIANTNFARIVLSQVSWMGVEPWAIV